MPGRDGQNRRRAQFAFETHRPQEERSRLFEQLRAFAFRQRWPIEIAHEIELILEEWVTDVISYGLVHVPEPLLRVEIFSRPDHAKIVVTDHGIPFDPTRQPEPDFSVPVERRPIGGLGIFMMRKLSTVMTYKRLKRTNVVTIEKDLTSPRLGQR
jgi:anti-sigma regulatory factor (Ser/Thr protein kinase)